MMNVLESPDEYGRGLTSEGTWYSRRHVHHNTETNATADLGPAFDAVAIRDAGLEDFDTSNATAANLHSTLDVAARGGPGSVRGDGIRPTNPEGVDASNAAAASRSVGGDSPVIGAARGADVAGGADVASGAPPERDDTGHVGNENDVGNRGGGCWQWIVILMCPFIPTLPNQRRHLHCPSPATTQATEHR